MITLMNEFIKNIKLKLIVIFSIPAIAMIYFSSGYLKDKIIQYNNTKYLDRISSYIYTSGELIEALQRERGASIAYISKQSKFFKEQLIKAREVTDKDYNKIKSFLIDDNSIQNRNYLKKIVESYSDIGSFREKVDKVKVDIFEILKYYSNIISNLISSTNILKSKFVNEEFFRTIIAYRRVMMLGETSGKERALITYALESKKIFMPITLQLIRLEMKFQQIKQDLLSDATVSIYTIYRSNINKRFENNLTAIKEAIIFKQDINIIDSHKWWSLSTRYIKLLKYINEQLLQKMIDMKNSLKYSAMVTLLISFILWAISLIALFLLLKTIDKIITTTGKLVNEIEEQKKLYRILSEFSEILIYNSDKHTIFTSMFVVLEQTDFFKYLWLVELKDDKIYPIITENFSISTLKRELKKENEHNYKIFDEIKQVFRSGKYAIYKSQNIDSPIYNDVEIFYISPILYKDRVNYVIVSAFRKEKDFNISISDMMSRICDNLTYAFEKIDFKEREKRLQDELRVAASAFDAHEAIAVTNKDGYIIKVNKAFTEITGYREDEVIGENPSILKSGKHDKDFYIQMWDSLRKNGYWRGEIYNKRKNGEIYPELLSITAVRDENGKITNYVAHFFDISNIKEAQKKAEYRALHDPLTDLLNRQGLTDELELIYNYSKMNGEYNAFLFFDMDNFKHINDYYGHEMGDKLLKVTAEKLKESISNGDIVGRIAGDEFAIILISLGKDKSIAMTKATIFVESLLNRFKEPILIDDIHIELSFSIGIKIFPDKEINFTDVIVNADVAMYQAKKSGKNRFHFFDENLDIESKRYLQIKNELAYTINHSKDDLKIYYQPKVSVETNEIIGFEALVRWNHPSGKILTPDKFLFATVGNTLGFKLNRIILEHIYTQIKQWQERYPNFDKRISINISAEQFNNDSFEDDLISIINSKEIDPKLIDLEIVEDALLQDTQKAIKLIENLKLKGFTFSIDDFGTGYSSLNYLYQLPVDTIKIDKSFVMNINQDKNKILVKMMIDTAKLFDMETVAEGVEDEETLKILKSYGCDIYQGYFFSKPKPVEEIDEMLDREYNINEQ